MFRRFKEYFSFTKKELNGLLVFCILLLFVWIAPFIASWFQTEQVVDSSEFQKEIAAFRASEKKYSEQHKYYHAEHSEIFNGPEIRRTPVYFKFNPNNLSVSDWLRLGLSEKQATVILNYEAKGGRFRRKEDLQKIYSLRPGDYERLEPYIEIPPAAEYKKEYKYKTETRLSRPAVLVDLNRADSANLEMVRGIGPVLASRIIKYRNRLGGFYRKEQLREVYGIDSERYVFIAAQLKTDGEGIQKININTADFDQLKRHPYLSYKQMNAIIQYRKQHGPYHSVDDLKKIAILNEEILRKIAPYLIF